VHPLINQIEEFFLPEMERLASDLQEQHPALPFKLCKIGTICDHLVVWRAVCTHYVLFDWR
jgi:hypothetical protein